MAAKVTPAGSEREERLARQNQRGRAAEHDHHAGQIDRVNAARGSGKRSGKGNCTVHKPHHRPKMLTKG